MNLFQNKKIVRKIGPKILDTAVGNKLQNNFKSRLYEDQINLDRMRKYRLKRVRDQLLQIEWSTQLLLHQ